MIEEIKLKKQIKQLQIDYTDLDKLKEIETEKIEQALEQLNDLIESQEVAQTAAQQTQQYVHKQTVNIVNDCLQFVFDDLYEFQIRFTPKRGKTEAEFVFIKEGREISKTGGGVKDVTAFALQFSSLYLKVIQKQLRPVAFLDQPFPNVSEDKGYLQRIPRMIKMLSKEFGIQFIQVTHAPLLQIGKIIDLGKE